VLGIQASGRRCGTKLERDIWSTKSSNAPYCVGPWKLITKLGPEFFQNTYFRPGNGAHTRFWKNKWLNGTIFVEKFPSMYQIAVDKNSTIAQNRNGNNWAILLRRAINDWEMHSLIELLAEVEEYNIDENKTDAMCWGSKGTFTVKECYRQQWYSLPGSC